MFAFAGSLSLSLFLRPRTPRIFRATFTAASQAGFSMGTMLFIILIMATWWQHVATVSFLCTSIIREYMRVVNRLDTWKPMNSLAKQLAFSIGNLESVDLSFH